MFAIEHERIEPDLLCLGKGLTGGYLPLAATLASEEIFSAFLAPYEAFEAFFHGHTFTGNPLASAVALANLDLFEREAVLSRVAARSHQLTGLLAEIGNSVPHVGDVRQWGLMIGLELVRDRVRRTAYDPADRIGAQVARHARERGVILRPLGNVVVLMPPLSITADEIDRLVRVTVQSIETATA